MATVFKPGCGLDVGTGLIIAARGTAQGIAYREFRNAYVALPEDNRAMLEMTGTPFIEVEGQIFAVGDDAVDLAFNTHSEIHRPMAEGLIHPNDTKAKPVLAEIFKALLGEPAKENEPVFFSVPADPEGKKGANLFHTKLIGDILQGMGYTPRPVIEGVALSYAEAQSDRFTALCFSFGAGTTNIALTFKSLPVFSFSVPQGGDWIDSKSAISTGVPVQDITVLKERGIFDLGNGTITEADVTPQQQRELDSIATHYESLVTTVIQAVKTYIELDPTHRVNIAEVPIIIGGGTAKATNFIELFKKLWAASGTPIRAKSFRLAEPVQFSVSKGCYYASQMIK